MKALLALYVSNAKEFSRDRMAMFFTLLLPIAFALFFGTLFDNPKSYKLNIGIANLDRGPAGERFVEQLGGPERQVLSVTTGSRDDLVATLQKGKLDVVLVLPESFSQALGLGQTASVDVLYDPTRPASAGTGMGIVRTMLAEANMNIAGAARLIVPHEGKVQGSTLRSVDFFVPNMLALALLWLGLFATAQPLVELREQQVLKRLGATPLSRTSLLIGQVSWRVTLALIQATLFLIVGKVAMGVQVTGNWPLFVAAVALGALVFVSMGYLIAGISKTADSSIAIAQICQLRDDVPVGLVLRGKHDAFVLPADNKRAAVHLS